MADLPTERWYRSLALTALTNDPFMRLVGVEVELTGGKRVDALYVSQPVPTVTQFTIVEVKRQTADARALVQLLGYMSRLRLMGHMGLPGMEVGGILAAPDFADDVIEAVALNHGRPDGVQLYHVGTGDDGWSGLEGRRFGDLLGAAESDQVACQRVRSLTLAALGVKSS